MLTDPVRTRRALRRARLTLGASLPSAAVTIVLAGCLVAGCTAGSPRTAPTSRGSPATAPAGGVPTVAVVPQPAGGLAGPVVAVEGMVDWVVPGYPGCAALRTRHQPSQVLSLVGTTADQQRHAAETGGGPTTEQARITGYVPPAAATVCPGLTFSVQQVEQMSPMTR